MKSTAQHFHFLNGTALFVAMACCANAGAGSLTAAPATVSANPPKSVFVDIADKGKDPFFPSSTRRLETVPQTSVATNTVPETSALFGQLQLKGISGTRGAPLAIINGATVGVGEVVELRLGNRPVKVRCRQIRENSVLLELQGTGEVRELKLRNNI